jgi:hypothetical protein
MNAITLSWETWRAVIAALREKAVPYMLEHADRLEQHLERHGPDEPTVRLSPADDVFPRSSTRARGQLGTRLPATWRSTVDAEAATARDRRRRHGLHPVHM